MLPDGCFKLPVTQMPPGHATTRGSWTWLLSASRRLDNHVSFAAHRHLCRRPDTRIYWGELVLCEMFCEKNGLRCRRSVRGSPALAEIAWARYLRRAMQRCPWTAAQEICECSCFASVPFNKRRYRKFAASKLSCRVKRIWLSPGPQSARLHRYHAAKTIAAARRSSGVRS